VLAIVTLSSGNADTGQHTSATYVQAGSSIGGSVSEKFENRMTKFETNPNIETRNAAIKRYAMLRDLSLIPRFSGVLE